MRYLFTCAALAVAITACGGSGDATPTATTTNPTFDAMWKMWIPMTDDERATTCATFEVTPARVIDHLAANNLDPTKVAAFLDAWCTS